MAGAGLAGTGSGPGFEQGGIALAGYAGVFAADHAIGRRDRDFPPVAGGVETARIEAHATRALWRNQLRIAQPCIEDVLIVQMHHADARAAVATDDGIVVVEPTIAWIGGLRLVAVDVDTVVDAGTDGRHGDVGRITPHIPRRFVPPHGRAARTESIHGTRDRDGSPRQRGFQSRFVGPFAGFSSSNSYSYISAF